MFFKEEIRPKILGPLIRLIYLVGRFVFAIIYRNDYQKLPPIKNPILLESAVSLASKIRTKQVKCVDVMSAYIDRIREVQPYLNAVVDQRYLEALEDARQADQFLARDEMSVEELAVKKPLFGVPFTAKDTIEIKGMKRTCGFIPLKDYRPSEDADIVALMKQAGAIPVAITNVPEMAMWNDSNNKLYGRTKNPFRSARIAGGSSGGEGALLSAGASIVGLGSDFGGSVRIPAFCCGVFGHKPSSGIVSLKGHFPLPHPKIHYMLVQGPMCRYATDLRPILKILAAENAAELNLDEKVSLNNIQIYYMEDDGGSSFAPPVKKEMKAALQKVLDHFRQTYNIVPKQVHLRQLVYSTEMWAAKIMEHDEQEALCHMLADKKGEVSPAEELVKYFFGRCDHTLAALFFGHLEKVFRRKEYLKNRIRMSRMANDLKQELLSLLGNNGVFLFPSNPTPAMYHRETITNFGSLGYTGIFNVLEVPVTQCPVGLGPEGLPLGLQVVGGLKKDNLTLAVAEEIEKAFGGWVKPCPTS